MSNQTSSPKKSFADSPEKEFGVEEFFNCECSMLEHTIRLTIFGEDEVIYVDALTNHWKNCIQRFFIALGYMFGLRPKHGLYHPISIYWQDAPRMVSALMQLNGRRNGNFVLGYSVKGEGYTLLFSHVLEKSLLDSCELSLLELEFYLDESQPFFQKLKKLSIYLLGKQPTSITAELDPTQAANLAQVVTQHINAERSKDA